MKKVFAILFAFIILLSGAQITVSMHYCDGKLAASKVSVWGSVASCGMEETKANECSKKGNDIQKHCCDIKVSVYEVDNNYSPTFPEYKTIEQPISQVFNQPVRISLFSLTSLFQQNISPPEPILASIVSLPKICVFRI